MNYITDELIQKLYIEYNTPEHVKAHCKGVTACALKLAHALNESHPEIYHLNNNIIYGAGMVHDMARLYEDHDFVCADKLQELGFDTESEIVRWHMRSLNYSPINEVTEADLIYISDRLVLEDTYVGVEKRFDYIHKKMLRLGKNPNSEHSKRNFQNAIEFVNEIERATGRNIDEICGN